MEIEEQLEDAIYFGKHSAVMTKFGSDKEKAKTRRLVALEVMEKVLVSSEANITARELVKKAYEIADELIEQQNNFFEKSNG